MDTKLRLNVEVDLYKKEKLITRTFLLYLCLFTFFRTIMSGIFSIYYSDNGISDGDISTIKAYQNIGILIGLLPAGFLADKFGRLKVLSLSSITIAFSFLIMLLFRDIFYFSIAEFIYGIGLALNSGIVLAYINDMQEKFNLRMNSKIMGHRTSLINITVLLSGNIGGLLYDTNIAYPLLLSIGGLLLYPLIIYFWTKYNNLSDNRAEESKTKISMFNKKLLKSRDIRLLLLLHAFIEGSAQFVLIYWSIYFVIELQFNLALVYSISVIGVIFGGQLYSSTINRLNTHTATLIYLSIVIVSITLIPFFPSYIGLLLFGCFQIGFGATDSALHNLDNKVLFKFTNKAQTMSTMSFISEIIIILILFVNKNIIDVIPLKYMFFVSGAIAILAFPIVMKMKDVTINFKGDN